MSKPTGDDGPSSAAAGSRDRPPGSVGLSPPDHEGGGPEGGKLQSVVRVVEPAPVNPVTSRATPGPSGAIPGTSRADPGTGARSRRPETTPKHRPLGSGGFSPTDHESGDLGRKRVKSTVFVKGYQSRYHQNDPEIRPSDLYTSQLRGLRRTLAATTVGTRDYLVHADHGRLGGHEPGWARRTHYITTRQQALKLIKVLEKQCLVARGTGYGGDGSR